MASLKNKQREIWIFEVGHNPAGQLRLDLGEKNEISILISPEYMGKGYGGSALQLLWSIMLILIYGLILNLKILAR